MKGSPFYRNFGIGSPNKQTEEKVTVYKDRDNEKGQSQSDIVKMRNKNIKDYDDAVSEYENEDGQLDITDKQYEAYKKKMQALRDAQTHSTDSINTVNKNINLKIESDNKKKKEDAKNKEKKADDSGLFMKSPYKQTYDASGADERVYDVDQTKYDKWRGTEDINTGEKGNAPNIRYLGSKENKKHLDAYLEFKKSTPKPKKETKEIDYYYQGKKDGSKGTKTISPNKQFEEGDYYDTRSKKSPNKQRDLGGTKSGKGNIFTKRGRTQKKINTERAETSKLTAEHVAKNKKATKLAVKAHEEKMIKKQLKNRPKTVVIQKQNEIKSNTTRNKDVTDQYR